MPWPDSAAALRTAQEELARAAPPPFVPPSDPAAAAALALGGVFVCFARGVPSGPGRAGEPGVAAAALCRGHTLCAGAVVHGPAGAAFEPGLLALREGPLLEAALLALPRLPDVIFVNATGRDHPRRAGLALHLGQVLDRPTVGVTSRPLEARGAAPADQALATSPLERAGEIIGTWLRTRQGARPLAIHAGWRTDANAALRLVLLGLWGMRTPEPLRQARRLARTERARSDSPARR